MNDDDFLKELRKYVELLPQHKLSELLNKLEIPRFFLTRWLAGKNLPGKHMKKLVLDVLGRG